LDEHLAGADLVGRGRDEDYSPLDRGGYWQSRGGQTSPATTNPNTQPAPGGLGREDVEGQDDYTDQHEYDHHRHDVPGIDEHGLER
jgi:hypothetical protein